MGDPNRGKKGTVYVLEKQYAGTVLEVGGEDKRRQEVVLSLAHGNVRLSGLTLDEARACGAHIYRPVVVRVQVKLDDGIRDERSHQKKGAGR